jgi:hypothetical protein
MGLACWVGCCDVELRRYLILGVGHGFVGQTKDSLEVPLLIVVVGDEDVLG